MKSIFVFLFSLFATSCFSQTTDTLKAQPIDTSGVASFVTRLDIANATKDGFYLNGYVVNINYEKAKELNGKKIQVTGKVRIVKGVKNRSNTAIQQGREADTKHIDFPKIEIIKE